MKILVDNELDEYCPLFFQWGFFDLEDVRDLEPETLVEMTALVVPTIAQNICYWIVGLFQEACDDREQEPSEMPNDQKQVAERKEEEVQHEGSMQVSVFQARRPARCGPVECALLVLGYVRESTHVVFLDIVATTLAYHDGEFYAPPQPLAITADWRNYRYYEDTPEPGA